MRGGEHRGTGADAFILEISGKALVKPRKEKLAHRPHDFGKMLRCFPVNVVFNVNILIQQSAERAGRSDENFRLLLGLNQNIKADFLHRTGGRQRADFAGTGGKQGNFPLLAGLDKDAELAGEDKQNAETVIVTAVEKIAALIRRQDGRFCDAFTTEFPFT